MTDIIQRLDVSHEAVFVRPAFELMRGFPSIIKEFYEVLGTKFKVVPAHTTINSTNNFGELSVRIGLFNNAASVEFRAEKLSVSLPNITTREAVDLAKDTIALSREALIRALPQGAVAASNFIVSVWIALEGGVSAAEQILRKCSAPADAVDVSAWGASMSRHGLRLLTRNDAEGWSLTVFGDPSLVPGSHLFLSLDFSFVREGIGPIAQQIGVVESKVQRVFQSLGLNIADSGSVNAG